MALVTPLTSLPASGSTPAGTLSLSNIRGRLTAALTGGGAATLNLIKRFEGGVWGFVDGAPIQNRRATLKDVPARTEQSDAMSKDLKRRGFKFVGTTICYAFMQAVGMVNDHLVECFRHQEVRKLKRG